MCYESLIQIMTHAAELTIPQSKLRKRPRRRWNETLKSLHMDMRIARQEWIKAGKPRDPDAPERLKYKQHKRIFRAELRKHDARLEDEFYNNLDSAAEIDQCLFWKLLKSHRREPPQNPPPMRFDGRVFYGSHEICEEWASYFESIFTPNTTGKYDENFRGQVEREVNEMQNGSGSVARIPTLDQPFALSEIIEAIMTLKNAKACGHDGISNEHIKYGGHALHAAITELFNAILRTSHIPTNAKRGVIHTLYKGKGKDKSDPRSYRPITLLPSLYKLLEKLILSRINVWVTENNISFPNKQQSAYQKGRSCVSTSFVLQETVSHMLERNSKVYCCFLDTAKAFDTVWHAGLLFKLFRFGIQGSLWRLIRACYSDIQSCVMENGVCSSWFEIRQGVRQGGVLSTWLYILYIDDLLNDLDKLGVGAKLGDIDCGSPCHADDLALLSIMANGLNSMLSCSFHYSIRWRYDFNYDKCIVIVFGESPHQWAELKNSRTWMLGQNRIAEDCSSVHLGLIINKHRKSTNVAITAAQKLKASLMSIVGPGLQPHYFNPVCAFRLYKLVCISRALYGSELWTNLTDSDLLILERAHRFCLKRMQGFNRTTRTPIALSMIGCHSMQGLLDERCLLFFNQLSKMSVDSVPLQVFAFRYRSLLDRNDSSRSSLGYVQYLSKTLSKYHLHNILEQFMSDGSYTLPRMPPGESFKSLIKKSILNHENSLFLEDCFKNDLERTLRIEKSLDYPSLVWLAAREYPQNKDKFAFLARLNTLTIPSEPVMCLKCSTTYSDPHVHFFCVCLGYSSNRELFWKRVEDECCVLLNAALWNMDDESLAETLLGKQLEDFDFEVNIELLNLAAECWFVL